LELVGFCSFAFGLGDDVVFRGEVGDGDAFFFAGCVVHAVPDWGRVGHPEREGVVREGGREGGKREVSFLLGGAGGFDVARR
jgi:hypothetical protein